MGRAVDALDAQQLLAGEIAEILGGLAVFQRGQHGGGIHQLAAGEVQHPHAVLAHVQRLGVDGVLGGGHVGHVDGQVVAAGQHVGQRDAVLHAARKAPRRVDADVGVVAQHLHAQSHGGVGHLGADGPQPDDAQHLAAQLRADKLLFALFHVLGQRGAAFQALGPVDGVGYVAAARHQRAHHQLGHRVGVGAGGVEHHDAGGGAFVDGDVVGACAGPRDGQQAVRQRHIVQVGAAHQDALGLGGVAVHLEQMRRQLCQPHRRDRVERFDGIHGMHLDFYIIRN